MQRDIKLKLIVIWIGRKERGYKYERIKLIEDGRGEREEENEKCVREMEG